MRGGLAARLFLPVVLALGVGAAAACGGDAASQPTATSPVGIATSTPGTIGEQAPEWRVVSEDIRAVFATPDLAVGPQRVALVLSDGQGLIKLPVLSVSSYRYPDGFGPAARREGPVETTLAEFHLFPFGTRGIHVLHLDFDRAGDWSIEAAVPRPDGSISTVEVRFPVTDRTRSVAVGERPPASMNRTLSEVDSVADLTTGTHRDEELYRLTVADALEGGRPFVVVFASPAFCTNAVCGPQVEVASALRERYDDRVDFIHVDLYENPREIQGDLSRARVTPLLAEWGLVSQEWTYVVGSDGLVTSRFENFVPEPELETAIKAVLGKAQGRPRLPRYLGAWSPFLRSHCRCGRLDKPGPQLLFAVLRP